MKKILSSILFLIICIAVEAQTCSAPIALNIVYGNTYRFWTDSIVGIQSYAWIVTTFEDDTATSSGSYSSTSSAYFAGSTFNSPDYVQVCLTLTFVDGCVSSNCDTFPYCDAGFTYALNEQYALTLTPDFPAGYMNELHYWTVSGPGIPNPTQNTEIATYYVAPGATYNVCQQLMITSSGCNTTECQDITIPDTILPVCDAAFTYYYQTTNAYLNVSSPYAYGQGSFEHNWLVTSYMSDGTVNTNNQLNVNNNSLFVAANTSALEICHTLTNLNTGCVDSSCQYLDFCTAEYTHVIDTANQVLTLTAGGVQTLASHSWNVTYHATGGVYDSEILNGPIATFLLPEGILDMTICHVVNNTFPGSTCFTYACDTIVFCNAEFTVIDNGNGTAGIWAVSPPTPGAVYTWSITGPGYNGAAYSGSYFNFTPVPNEPYYVCMAYFNAETGCSASNCDTVVVEGISDTCSAEFTLNYENFILTGIPVTPYTSGNEYVWTINSSNYGAVSYSSMNFIHTLLPDAGEVTVCLNVTNTFLNCSDVYCDNIQISSPDTTCTAEIVMGFAPDGWPMFSATSNSTIALYSWVLTPYDSNGEAVGTGFYSSQSNSYIPSGVAYVYIEACLELTFTSGCVWNNCQTFTAPPDTSITCNASIQYSYVGDVPNPSMFPYQFYSAYSSDTAAVIHSWVTSDAQTSSSYSPLFGFAPGTYTVCHSVSNVNGLCSDSTCISLTVAPDSLNGCTAMFSIEIINIATYEYAFTNVSSDLNASFIWQFGDGSTESGLNATHTFTSPGLFPVTLSMTGNGCFDENTYYLSIVPYLAPEGCSVSFSYTSQIANPLEVVFDASLSVVAGNNPGFIWNFGDGTFGSGSTVSHTYSTDSSYAVCLTAYSDSCTNTFCDDVFVGSSDTISNSCYAFFTTSGDFDTTGVFEFVGVGNNPNAYHLWTFGDGTSSTLAAPLHNYTNTGLYEVCHITGIEGFCADTLCTSIIVGLYIRGFVNAGPFGIDLGSAKLYRLDTLSSSVEFIAEVSLNNAQTYYFLNLTEGVYLVRAGLSDSSVLYDYYMPSYYGNSYYWYDAEPIYLNTSAPSGYLYNFQLIYGSNPGGNGTVNGSIDDGPFRLSNPELSSAQSPVLGAQVIITDLANVPQRWVRTDNSGAFSISDLAYGTYRLMADEPGMTCLPIEFTLSEQTPGVTIDLVMGDEITGIVSYETPFVQGEVYPNPSNSLAKLNIELMKPASLTMTMISITGQVMWTQTNSFLQGKSSIQIPVRGIADGLYFLSIYSDEGQLITSRKMQVAN